MVHLNLALLLEVAMRLSHLRQYASQARKDGRIDGGTELAGRIVDLYENLKACGLEVTADCAFDICSALMEGTSAKQVAYLTGIFNVVLIKEFSGKAIMMLPSERAKYNGPPQKLFGESVCNAFPSALADLEEAGKCLAFARSTAGVFHLMRSMEAGLKCVGHALGIPYAPSWESYIKQITAKIEAKHQTKGVRWKKDEPYFKDLLGDLQAVKLAWRNPTMHIVRRYTPEEAEDVFIAVKAFLQRLAVRFPENGRKR